MAEKRRKPKYKIGDIVTIKSEREGEESDYLFSFNDDMVSSYGGTSHRIEDLEYWGNTGRKRFSDDGYLYKLEDGGGYNWASSMFEDPNGSLSYIDEISDGSIDAFIRKKKCPELDFNL